MLLAYIVGALIIWAMAFWSLRDTLGAMASEGWFAGPQGLGISQLAPALLMLGAVVAVPVVLWGTLAEYDARLSLAEDGLCYQSMGIAHTFPWADMREVARSAQRDTIVLRRDTTADIASPAVRLLLRLALGKGRLPLPRELEGHERLVDAIEQQIEQRA